MTDELHCEKCDETVHVERRRTTGLVMACGCSDEMYSIKTAGVIPVGWSA